MNNPWVHPTTHEPLIALDIGPAEDLLGEELRPTVPTPLCHRRPESVLVAAGSKTAFPVVDGIPILLEPEMMSASGVRAASCSLDEALYADVYEEMCFYDNWAAAEVESRCFQDDLEFLRALAREQVDLEFPFPSYKWLRPSPALGGEHQMLKSISPVEEKVCLQIGGRGVEGAALAIAGSAAVLVISPMAEELRYGRLLAQRIGLDDRMHFCCGLAEMIPLPDASVDRVISRHSMHHTRLGRAISQIERTLSPGGKFASIDVWRAPLYDLGIRLFGKMTPGVNCQPLSEERLAEISLDKLDLRETSHGALLRYPLAVLQRMGYMPSGATCERLSSFEDRLATRSRVVSRQRSMVCLAATLPRHV